MDDKYAVTITYRKAPTFCCELHAESPAAAKYRAKMEAINSGWQEWPVKVTVRKMEHTQ